MKKANLIWIAVLAVALTAGTCFAEDSGYNNCPWRYKGSGNWGHMMDRDWHMYGNDWRSEHGMMSGRQNMTPDQLKQFDKIWGAYLKDTLSLRQQMASKKLTLEMLWHQPQVDEEEIGKISSELADLETQLKKKHDQYLLQCRKAFGNQEWACPGSRW